MITFSRLKFFGASAVALVCTTQFALAQSNELTADEITDAFNKQKTRGLVIVPSTSATEATDEAVETTVAAAPAEYQPVASEDQVNIQVRFDFASAALRDDQKPKLSSLCQAMKNVDVNVFQIIGHTDSAGSADYNQNLSLLRAKEVKRFLVSDCGIAEGRLEVLGVGEAEPLNKDDPRADENRRVEFQALG
ncbi:MULTISPECIES: OmpA family protein [unclassified Ruegeria]|uniref:OmpA family protein n=1 Tax=unclassified Ruegeria TaxID=2625375 RepID=UPI001ADA321E|nr:MULTISPECIES: OmpA family protein [unclassified Ruegeria]MBO9413462.1 OmpA family protein [Ruegeria sp. R8_1]MBO9417355.1 OmpA family protein [Ruegeria sp. R8_2]